MKSFDNDEIGHLNDGHQRITFKHKGQLCICKKTISHTHTTTHPHRPRPDTHTHNQNKTASKSILTLRRRTCHLNPFADFIC